MIDPALLAALSGLAIGASYQWHLALSPRARAHRAAQAHLTSDRSLPVHNPNLCEDCIGDAMPEAGFAVSNTGQCGDCGQITDVWDLEHLADLEARGIPVLDETGRYAIENPLRNSHTMS
jgi:hypothetical protein|tara:strand:- start:396 stop:755 length:360 start_codon:yes stop_codon:yes gene_type:complete